MSSSESDTRFTSEFRRKNIGDVVQEESPSDWPFFIPSPEFFTPIRREGIVEGSWLSVVDEPGQSYDSYEGYNPIDEDHDTIYLVTLDATASEDIDLVLLQESVQLYYSNQLKVKLIDSHQDPRFSELDAILDKLPNVYCLVGITSVDLYPDETYNFVLGSATYLERFGVFSYCRYLGDRDRTRTLLHQLTAICVHEIGHQFMFRHCIDYLCVMNGSNSTVEADHQPTRFCPSCLRKLKKCIGFDLKKRYEALHAFCAAHPDIYGRKLGDWFQRRILYQQAKSRSPVSVAHAQQLFETME